MEEGEERAAEFEAALGLNPRHLVDDVLDMVDDIGYDAFQYARQKVAGEGILGEDEATPKQKAAELERGFNAMHHLVLDVLDKRMTSWETYCFGQIFTLPEDCVLPEDDNSYAKESQRDDLELDLLRKKLESAIKESDNLRWEMSLLERQTTFKSKLESSIAEIQKIFEEKSRQQKIEGLVKDMPILVQQIISLRKRTEGGNSTDLLRDSKRLAKDKDVTARTEDIQKIVNILQNK